MPFIEFNFFFISAEKLSINDKLSKIWKDGMEFCKIVNNGFYLLGNITLIDARSACMGLQNSGPGWIGIIKENFEKLDQGNATVLERI